MVYMIWLVMYGSGWQIGIQKLITRFLLHPTLQDLLQVNTSFAWWLMA